MVASVASEAGKKAEGPGAAREENGGVFRFGKREGEAGSRESWGGNDGLPSRRTEAGRSGNAGGVSVTDLLRLAVGVLVINCLMSYFVTNESVSWGWRPWFSKPRAVQAWWVSLIFEDPGSGRRELMFCLLVVWSHSIDGC